jgi:hypothetical protein
MKILTLAVACLAFGVSTAHAERMALEDALGKTVTVWSSERMQGRLTWVDTDIVTIRLPTGESRTVERASIFRMRVLAHHGARYYAGQALVGAAGGALTGLSLAAFSNHFCRTDPTECGSDEPPSVGYRYRDAALGGAVLGVARYLIPAWLNRWRNVEVGPSVQTGVVPIRRGVAVMATISF